jgi:hypothetical protein
MAGLDPAIHVFWSKKGKEDVDARDKPGHDDGESVKPGHDDGESDASACRRPSLAAVDLAAHQRDGLLIDACGIPLLDGRDVGLARLVSRAGAPAMRLQKVRGRAQSLAATSRLPVP